jgi:hypothetical protein
MRRMANFPSIPDLIERVLRQEIRRWIEENLPKPDRTITTDLRHATIKPLQESPMPAQSFAATLANDEPFGYELGFPSLNKSGVQVTDVPVLSTTDAAMGTITFIAPGRYWIQLADSAPKDAVVTMSGDFDPNQTTDNFEVVITMGSDTVLTNMEGATITALTAAPV